MTFVFPLPPNSMRVNRRQGHHWGPDHKDKTVYLLECKKAVQDALYPGPPVKRCNMTLTVFLGKGQRCDPPDAGAWAKGAIDVLVAENVLVDDDASCIRSFTVMVQRDRERPRLEITVDRETE